jgi:hypothetical protein
MFAFLNLSAAAGDALLYGMLWRVPPRAWVLDHPSEMGGLVLGHADAEVPPVPPDSLFGEETDASVSDSGTASSS